MQFYPEYISGDRIRRSLMPDYTLGLFANMYPAYDGDYRGIFIRQMVRDLETRGVTVRKAVKTYPSVFGYIPFLYHSVYISRNRSLDLMQADYIPHSSLVPAYLKRTNVPLILKFHGDDARIYPFKNRFNLMLTKSMLRRAAHIITGSEEMKRTLISLGEKPERISAIHTGVDTVFFSPLDRNECRSYLGLPTGAPIFLFVGRLHPWKGINELTRGCPHLPRFYICIPRTGRCSRSSPQLPVHRYADACRSEDLAECCRLPCPANLYRICPHCSHGSLFLRDPGHNDRCRRMSGNC